MHIEKTTEGLEGSLTFQSSSTVVRTMRKTESEGRIVYLGLSDVLAYDS